MTYIRSTQGNDNVIGTSGSDNIIDPWGDDIIDGGDGDDVIVDEGGNNTLRGGAGNDHIILRDFYSGLATPIGVRSRSNLVEGGTGDDLVDLEMRLTGSTTIDLGDGNDVVRVRRIQDSTTSITLGAGRDRVLLDFEYGQELAGELSFPTILVNDFIAGAGGDIIDLAEALRGFFASPSFIAAYNGVNPFANGVVRLVQDGADTIIRLDYDGNASGNGPTTRDVIRLVGVTASQLTSENLAGFDLSGAAPVSSTANGSANNDLLFGTAGNSTINGLAGDDRLYGSHANDTLEGGAGNDRLFGGSGNDILRGGDGDDVLLDDWGSDSFEGGAGNDRIALFRPMLPSTQSFLETITINAGSGNDYVSFEIETDSSSSINRRRASLTVDLGAGDDVFYLPHMLSVQPTLTLGTGRDRVLLGTQYTNGSVHGNNVNTSSFAPLRITDFTSGDSGDILEVDRAIFVGEGWNGVSNPFASGHVRLVQVGGDVDVIFDYDGTGGGSGSFYEFVLARLVGVQASALTAANFNGFNPNGSASGFIIAQGTAGDDFLTGSNGADIINGGAGNDRIEETHGGSDTLRGGDGEDVILVATGYAPAAVNLTVSGDAGNDLLDFSVDESSGQSQSLTADMGAGDDRVILRALPGGGTTLTLGTGRDVVEFDPDLAVQSTGSFVITDFETGALGDRLDWNLFAALEAYDGASDFNPFLTENARLAQSGADTLLILDGNRTLVTFRNTNAASFTEANLGFDPVFPTIAATAGNDTLTGTAQADVIWGLEGNDQISGRGGDDRLLGGVGDDYIDGDDGGDIIYGGLGADFMRGGIGNDRLDGQGGTDRIFGGEGDDRIFDLSGMDIIDGGTGNDSIFVELAYPSNQATGSINAGDGDDFVSVVIGASATFEAITYSISLGAGNDRILLEGSEVILTLGSGVDTIAHVPGSGGGLLVVNDFATGNGGDIHNIGNLIQSIVRGPMFGEITANGANPFAVGILGLRQVGNDVELVYNPYVLSAQYVVARYSNTTVAGFTAANFGGFDPNAPLTSFAIPALQTTISSTLAIAAGQNAIARNIYPESTALLNASSHFEYLSNSGDAQFLNAGNVLAQATHQGYAPRLIGFGVSRLTGTSASSLFHNQASGIFSVENLWIGENGELDLSTQTYGYYAPQQSTSFLNDGRFDVRSATGIAYGVLSGYNSSSHYVTNNGIMNITGGWEAIGIQLGFNTRFTNTGSITVTAPYYAVGIYLNQFNNSASFENSGSITVTNSPNSPYFSIGILISEGARMGIATPVFRNSGTITADVAFLTLDTSPPGNTANERIENSGTINGAIVLGAGNDVVLNLTGGQINGQIFLENGNDLYDGRAGVLAGEVHGGAGDDRFMVAGQDNLIFEEAGEGIDTVESGGNYYLYANIENLSLVGTANIFGVGNELNNVLNGNSGENLLIAGAGNDIVNGGVARDAIFGEDGADILNGDAGIDYIVAGIGNDTLDGGADADEMYGQEGDDIMRGGASFDTDIIVGGLGNDTIYGNSGLGDYDLLYGNEGNDIFYVDTPDDLVFEQAGEGNDTVYADINGTGFYLYDNIENLVLLDDTPFGVGNDLANQITGNAIGNYLLGGAGNDTLNGMGGNDVLFGESGNDLFVFNPGTGGDVIGDFARGQDRIDISAYGLTFAQVQAGFVQNGNVGAIRFANGDLIVLHDVTMSQLTAADFIFAPLAEVPPKADDLASVFAVDDIDILFADSGLHRWQPVFENLYA